MKEVISQGMDFTSHIFTGPNAEARIKDIASTTTRCFFIVDSNAAWFFQRRFGSRANCFKYVIHDPSESIKTLDTVKQILEFLTEMRAERSSVLIAIGGGVVLDTAGFAASIFKRGIPWIAIPSTLLSQVDASVGGKTAVNSQAAKNIYGTFYPPHEVVVTESVSESWTKQHYLEGIAEMYKIFRVFDRVSAKKLVATGNPSDRLIAKSIRIKADVVRCDPWEKNLRGILNYGHTFGHAFEHHCKMPHGLAVALGIRCENRVAQEIGMMSEKIRKGIDEDLDDLCFLNPSLMPSLPPFNVILDYMLQDKKTVGGNIRLAIIDGKADMLLNHTEPTTTVSVDVLKSSYERFCEDHGTTFS